MSIITKDYFENEKNRIKANEALVDVNSVLRGYVPLRAEKITLASYFLYKAVSVGKGDIESVCEIALDECNKDAYYLIQEYFKKEDLEKLYSTLGGKYNAQCFALATLISKNEDTDTPDSISKLAIQILNIQDDDQVLDMCCGAGRFLSDAAISQEKAKYEGVDINTDTVAISKIRAELLGADINVVVNNVFNLVDDDSEKKYDKVFSNYPFGFRSSETSNFYERYQDVLNKKHSGLPVRSSSDWIFNLIMYDQLNKDGKAIGIMTNGSTWNTIDTPIRKYFVENKMIESVIALPKNMFYHVLIPTTMIVLGNNPNDGIRMVNATEICQNGRRQNTFSEGNIETILNALKEDSQFSKIVSLDEIRKNDYLLNISRYQDVPEVEDGVPFGNVIKSITRGAPINARQLDEMSSNEMTDYHYLMLANINNDIIDSELPCLSNIEPKYDKYCLKNNNLILSKNGYPYKVAVANIDNKQKIMASGNLYVIELDEEKANPYYIKALFESDKGIALLNSITVGATIPNIGVDLLKKLEIPLPSLEEQEKIAQKNQAVIDEITILRARLEKAISRMRHVFDEESE